MYFLKLNGVWVPSDAHTASIALAEGHAVKWVGKHLPNA